jgi:hypothetical protein
MFAVAELETLLVKASMLELSAFEEVLPSVELNIAVTGSVDNKMLEFPETASTDELENTEVAESLAKLSCDVIPDVFGAVTLVINVLLEM